MEKSPICYDCSRIEFRDYISYCPECERIRDAHEMYAKCPYRGPEDSRPRGCMSLSACCGNCACPTHGCYIASTYECLREHMFGYSCDDCYGRNGCIFGIIHFMPKDICLSEYNSDHGFKADCCGTDCEGTTCPVRKVFKQFREELFEDNPDMEVELYGIDEGLVVDLAKKFKNHVLKLHCEEDV